jgi:serine/threonine protein kinase
MAVVECPDAGLLAQFALGDLSRDALARVAAHVEHCEACNAALTRLEGTADPLTAALRPVGDGGDATVPTADDAVAPELLDAALTARAGIASLEAPPLECPRRLGKFELLAALGSGSFGQVYRARDTELDRLVAIKVLRAGSLANEQEVDRLTREAKSAARLKHPGIVSLFDFGQTPDGAPFLVEEFIEGRTLAEQLSAARFDFMQAATLAADVAEALDYAHRHGVIHRDVKPSNIMLDPAGRSHLMDFGLAKREGDETPMTVEGDVLGTPAYMSPEQARGDSHLVDARSDVYGLGVVLYELLTGERPFRGNRRMLLLQVLDDEPRSPRQLNDKIPRDLETICLKALAKSPGRRYATASEFGDDLRRWIAGEPIKARPVGRLERTLRWCRRNPVPASLLLAVTLGSAFGFWHLSRLSEYLVRSTALESVKQQAEMLEEVDRMYTTEVVDRLAPLKVQITHDYRNIPSAIPLPATLNIDLGRRISDRSATGMQVRLYSDYPFKQRKDSGSRDDFERTALAELRTSPAVTIDRFEDFAGRPSLRFAKARIMGDGCVRCHNQHKESTKTDWKVGDVGGVLEIIRPLDEDIARTRAGLRGTFISVAAVGATLLGLSGLVLWGRPKKTV